MNFLESPIDEEKKEVIAMQILSFEILKSEECGQIW